MSQCKSEHSLLAYVNENSLYKMIYFFISRRRQIRSRQIRSRQIRSRQIRSRQIRSRQIRSRRFPSL
ncbi:MAG: hypothetical protein IIY81_01835, partial [Lachnospiraceae bacterium]|nr:hypothetical protein [Lachnospiraceae bacterium]